MSRTYSTNQPVIRLTPLQCGAILARNGSVCLRPELTAAEHRHAMEEGLLKVTVQSWSRDRVDYWVSLKGPRSSCTCPDWLRGWHLARQSSARMVRWCKHIHAVAVALVDRAAEERRTARGTVESPPSRSPREAAEEPPAPHACGWPVGARPVIACPVCRSRALLLPWAGEFGYACLSEGCASWFPLREYRKQG